MTRGGQTRGPPLSPLSKGGDIGRESYRRPYPPSPFTCIPRELSPPRNYYHRWVPRRGRAALLDPRLGDKFRHFRAKLTYSAPPAPCLQHILAHLDTKSCAFSIGSTFFRGKTEEKTKVEKDRSAADCYDHCRNPFREPHKLKRKKHRDTAHTRPLACCYYHYQPQQPTLHRRVD